jgi:hypothetical protein
MGHESLAESKVVVVRHQRSARVLQSLPASALLGRTTTATDPVVGAAPRSGRRRHRAQWGYARGSDSRQHAGSLGGWLGRPDLKPKPCPTAKAAKSGTSNSCVTTLPGKPAPVGKPTRPTSTPSSSEYIEIFYNRQRRHAQTRVST